MSLVEPGSAGTNLVQRAIAILTRPGATWDVIDTESASVGGLYRGYVIPLAAIPPIAGLIGGLVFGYGGFGFHWRPSPVWLVAQAIVGYALALAMVYVMALIIEALAPSFDGTKDRVQAFKVATYASTAAWVAGVFALIPALSILALLGLYSLYLFWVGLPKLMRVPQEKAVGYTAVVIIVAIVVALVINVVVGGVLMMGGANRYGPMMHASGKVTVPGGGSVDLARLEAASKRAQAAAEQVQSGKAGPATDPELLKAYLPASVAGYARTEVSASSGGVGGVEGSGVEGRYQKGDANLRLEVTDLGQAGALAGIAGAFNVRTSKETATGYEKVGTVNGRMTQESYDRSSKHGEYSVLVGERFMVQASGDGVSMDELKAAVQAVDPGRLESLAKAG